MAFFGKYITNIYNTNNFKWVFLRYLQHKTKLYKLTAKAPRPERNRMRREHIENFAILPEKVDFAIFFVPFAVNEFEVILVNIINLNYLENDCTLREY